jgi:hypothetical protein
MAPPKEIIKNRILLCKYGTDIEHEYNEQCKRTR